MPALAVEGRDANADLSASRMISHLLGRDESTRSGLASQSLELVMGGRLQFMLPLRSITKSMLAGISSALTVEEAQPPESYWVPPSGVLTMIPVPPAPPVPVVLPPAPLPPDPLPDPAWPPVPVTPASLFDEGGCTPSSEDEHEAVAASTRL